jgi:hypothetical protein
METQHVLCEAGAVDKEITDLWDEKPRSLVEICQRFRRNLLHFITYLEDGSTRLVRMLVKISTSPDGAACRMVF